MGTTFWVLVNTFHDATITVEVPICFYNTDTTTISAPEKVRITLSGRRADLKALNFTQLAAHIDASTLKKSNTSIPSISSTPSIPTILSEKHLLLPRSIKLVNYYPTNLILSVQHKELAREESTGVPTDKLSQK
ncbi:TPA: hypothetical protein DEG75_01910 [Candidatus Dependentiae bacterium]|nr:hypothetical protein [Candidatus Dependentiae bacterium]